MVINATAGAASLEVVLERVIFSWAFSVERGRDSPIESITEVKEGFSARLCGFVDRRGVDPHCYPIDRYLPLIYLQYGDR